MAATRQIPRNAQLQLDQATVRASTADTYPLLVKAQRAFQRAVRIAEKYADSADESAQEAARQLLAIGAHLDGALAGFAALEGG